jgi:type IV pilus assembly protein PilB
VLREAAHVPKRMVNAVVSRVKIMSDLNIAEKRVPQDGRVSVTVEERRVDLRITTLPTQRGEGATIRILDKDNAQRSLDDLGMDGERRERFEAAFRQSYGAGPRHRPDRLGKVDDPLRGAAGAERSRENIITIEDPVEYRLAGINQINVNRKAGSTSPPVCARSCAPTPTSSWSARSATARPARIAIEAALTGT